MSLSPLPLLPSLSPSLIADQTSLVPVDSFPCSLQCPHRSIRPRLPTMLLFLHVVKIISLPSSLPAFPCLSHSCFSNPLLSPTSPPPPSTFPLQVILNSSTRDLLLPILPTLLSRVLSLLDCKPFSLPVLCDNAHFLE